MDLKITTKENRFSIGVSHLVKTGDRKRIYVGFTEEQKKARQIEADATVCLTSWRQKKEA